MATIKSFIKKNVFKVLFPKSNPTLEEVFIKEAIRCNHSIFRLDTHVP